MPTGISIVEAARALSVTPACVHNWIEAGAPVVSKGRPGKDTGTRVIPRQILEWRAERLGLKLGGTTTVLKQVAVALEDVFRRDAGDGVPLHRSLGVSNAKAAALLVEAYQTIHRRVAGEDPVSLPAEISKLFGVCVNSARLNNRS